MKRRLTVEVPKELEATLAAAGYTPQKLSEEALRYFAAVLYARRVLSLEQAAHLAQMSVWDFVPFLGEQGIPVVNYDAKETATELEAAHWLSNNQKRS